MQQQVPAAQSKREQLNLLQMQIQIHRQWVDNVVDMSVVVQRQVAMVQTVLTIALEIYSTPKEQLQLRARARNSLDHFVDAQSAR